MASPMRKTATSKLKSKSWYERAKELFTQPIGYKPPKDQGDPYGPATARGRMLEQGEAMAHDQWVAPEKKVEPQTQWPVNPPKKVRSKRDQELDALFKKARERAERK